MKKKKVLIVENDESNQHLYYYWMSKLNLENIIVSSGGEALKNFPDFNPDITLIDLGLSDIDGYQLVEKIREIKPNHPMVAITGALFIKEGYFSKILKKPFKKTDFVNAIEMS